jgi:hypothetical protein
MGDNGESSRTWSRFARSTYWSRPIESEQAERYVEASTQQSFVNPRLSAEDRLVKISYMLDLLTMQYYKDIQNTKKKVIEDLPKIVDPEIVEEAVNTFWNNLNKEGNERLAMEETINKLFVSIAKKV